MNVSLLVVIVAKRLEVVVSAERMSRLRELFSDSPAKLHLGFPRWLSFFLQRGVIAITLGRTVYLSERMLERGEDELLRTLRHELVHIRQVAELGLIRFLYRYGREYLSLRRKGLRPFEAYSSISFEREAALGEGEAGSGPAEGV